MKRWLKKCIPSQEALHKQNGLGWLSAFMQRHPHLWSWQRGAVARAVGGGFLIAFIPLPIQIVLSVFVAFLFRANLAITAAATFITNPFTFIPFNYLIYQVGVFISHANGNDMPALPEIHFDWRHPWLIWQACLEWFQALGKNYLIGLPVVSVSAAIVGYCTVEAVWRLSVWWRWHRRKRGKSPR